MIPKLICFIFGHKRRDKAYTGMIPGTEVHDVLNRPAIGYRWHEYKVCPRCGVSLLKQDLPRREE